MEFPFTDGTIGVAFNIDTVTCSIEIQGGVLEEILEFRILNLRNKSTAFGWVCFPPAHGVNAVAFEPRQSPQFGAHGATHIATGVVRHGCVFQLFSSPGPEVAQEIYWGTPTGR